MGRVRQAIIDGKLGEFVMGYLDDYFGGRDKYPDWVQEAVKLAEINN